MMSTLHHVILYLWVILTVLLSFYLLPTQAVKGNFDYTGSNSFGRVIHKTFGMAEGGIITMNYQIQAENPLNPYTSYVLLLIVTEKEFTSWYGGLDTDHNVVGDMSNYCTLPSWKRKLLTQANDYEGQFNMTINRDSGSDRFSIILLQCKEGITTNPVTISLHYEMKNVRPNTPNDQQQNYDANYLGDFSHLAMEDVNLERFYGGTIIVYTLLTIGMLGMIYQAKIYAMPIHWLFFATVFSYLILSICQYYDFYYFNTQGEVNHHSDMAIRIFVIIVDTLSLASLFLVSLGWTILRSNITAKEAKAVIYSIGSFFIFGIGSAACTNPDDMICDSLDLVAFIIKSLLLLAIIIAMNFTVTQLRAMLNHTPWVPSTPLQYARCKQYQAFRYVFIIYLLLPTAFLLVQVTMYTWRESWIVVAVNEILNFFLIFHLGVTFSPLREPLMLRAFDGSLHRSRTD